MALIYCKTVLAAMPQVEAALILHQAAQARIASLRVASEVSATALRQARAEAAWTDDSVKNTTPLQNAELPIIIDAISLDHHSCME
jgi:hypothetical protein